MSNPFSGLQELEFQMNGGWTGLGMTLTIHAVKWVAIGCLFGLGWRIVS